MPAMTLADYLYPVSPYRGVSDNPAVQAMYVESRRTGTSHSMAEIFAFRRAPALKTATRWLAGHDRTVTEGTPPLVRDRMLASAREAGVNPDAAVYKGGLARYPGDPLAWVQSEDDVKRRADTLGRKLEGGIDYTPPGYDDVAPPESPSEYRVADDILENEFERVCEREPEMAHEAGAKEQLAEKLSGKE